MCPNADSIAQKKPDEGFLRQRFQGDRPTANAVTNSRLRQRNLTKAMVDGGARSARIYDLENSHASFDELILIVFITKNFLTNTA